MERSVQLLKKLALGTLIDLAERRAEIEEVHGKDALYTDELGSVLPHVAEYEKVRKAVKGGFKRRVEAVRDAGEHRILLVDGRNLGSIIQTIVGTRLVMRTFLYCSPTEAARRECLRAGLEEGTPEWLKAYEKSHDGIVKRNRADKNRELDPVIPEPNNINYWTSSTLVDETARSLAALIFDGNRAAALYHMATADPDLRSVPRTGAGYMAVRQGRQVYFDTSPFASYDYPGSLQSMLQAANTMFTEAVRARQILDHTTPS